MSQSFPHQGILIPNNIEDYSVRLVVLLTRPRWCGSYKERESSTLVRVSAVRRDHCHCPSRPDNNVLVALSLSWYAGTGGGDQYQNWQQINFVQSEASNLISLIVRFWLPNNLFISRIGLVKMYRCVNLCSWKPTLVTSQWKWEPNSKS